MFKRFKVTGINENPKKPKRNLMKYLALGCVMALPAFALLKTGVLSMNKNVLAADKNKYDIVADLDGGKFEMGTTPEFTKMDNGNWLYKYKPVPTPTKLPVPVKDGYDFTGWTVSAKPDIQKEYSIPAWHKGNLNVKANWKGKAAILMAGQQFNGAVERMPGFENVTEIVFEQNQMIDIGVDLSENRNGSVKGYISGNVLHIISDRMIYANKNCLSMFNGFNKINKIDFNNFNTENLKNMSWMFASCSNLRSINSLNVSTVSEVTGMFAACRNLTYLDLSSWNTSNLTDTCYMFMDCDGLLEANFSNFNFSNISALDGMFDGCSSLQTIKGLDLRSLRDGASVIDMFKGCSSLVCNITIPNVKTLYYNNIFTGCASNKDACVIVDYVGLPDLAENMVDTKNPGDNVYLKIDSSVLCNGTYFKKHLESFSGFTKIVFKYGVPKGDIDVSHSLNSSITARQEGNVIYIESLGKIHTNPDSSWMFMMKNLEDISFENFDTSIVRDMTYMFAYNSVKYLDVSGFDTSNVTTMEGAFAGCKSLNDVFGLEDLNISNVTNIAYMFDGCSSLSHFYGLFDTSNVTDMSYMFNGCTKLSSVSGITRLNTRKVTDMDSMFSGCSSLTDIDLSGFRTLNVTNMSNMFEGTSLLKTINLSSFNTSLVTDMSHMFENSGVTSILGLNVFNTENVKNMSSMFKSCKVTSLDLSKFKTYNVTHMTSMFENCEQLRRVSGLSTFDLSKLEFTNSMFAGCANLSGEITIAKPNVPDNQFTNMFFECSTTSPAKFIVKYTNDSTKAIANLMVNTKNNGNRVYLYRDTPVLVSGSVFNSKIQSVPNFSSVKCIIFDQGEAQSGIELAETGDGSIKAFVSGDTLYVRSNKRIFANEDSSEMFLDLNVSSIIFNNFDTSEVKNMSSMFRRSSSITSLDLRNFDTSLVENMSYMFSGCNGLNGLDVTSFNTSEVTDMCDMFRSCYNLESLDVRSFNVANVTDMSNMFRYCSKLKSLDLSGMDAGRVTSTSYMFSGCSAMTLLNLKGFSLYNNRNMNTMFGECSSLTILDLSGFDTRFTYNMSGMFYKCNSLVSLDLSHFDTSAVSDMSEMFEHCTSLKRLDLSSFTFTLVDRIEFMFYDTPNLSGNIMIDTSNITHIGRMFDTCATSPGAKFVVRYKNESCKALAEKLVATKTSNSNVILNAPETILMQSTDFKKALKSIPGVNNVTEIRFVKAMPDPNGVNVSREGDAKAYINRNTLVIASPGEIFANPNSSFMFADIGDNFTSLNTITFSNFNTSKVVDMSGMFKGCRKISSLDLRGFNTSNVTDMSYMFDFSSFKSLDLRGFDTSNVTNMSSMFSNCTDLNNIYGLGEFDTSKVTDMSMMFVNCYVLGGNVVIANLNIMSYSDIFTNTALYGSSPFTVDYTYDCELLVEDMINVSDMTGVDIGVLKSAPYNRGIKSQRKYLKTAVSEIVPQYAASQQSTRATKTQNKTINIKLINGQSAVFQTQTIQRKAGKIGDLAKPDLNPKYAGQFGGYFYDKNCTIPVKPNDVVTQDIELYAKW